MTPRPELEQQLRQAFSQLTDRDFGYHATDLYVVDYPGIREWLTQNYPFHENVRSFTGQHGSDWNGAGKACLDIPFAGKWS